MDTLISNNSLPLQTLTFPKALRLFVLAPHPDDFDAIGVTMRFLRENGNPLYVAVAASGASGVEDTFCSPPTAEVKTELREQEQRASCRFFGLPEAHLAFLRLEEDEAGHPLENEANTDRVRQHFLSRRPAVVFLPHGHDTNPGHRRVYAMFRQVAREAGYPLVAFLNRDPKTIRMRCDVYLGFGEEEAAWKGELLRFHRSQHQRNLNQRGHGMDERILRVDRQSAEACSVDAPYAEVFELEFFGASEFGDILAGLSPQTAWDIWEQEARRRIRD
jgi:LmbE family N-acetylglucosaminyl deacetylase